MSDKSAPLQLFHCTSKKLGGSLLKFDPEIARKPIEELTDSMQRLTVIPIVTGVLRTELKQMRQCETNSSGHLPLGYVEKLTHVPFLLIVLVV